MGENGKSKANTSTFLIIAYYLKTPLAYFLPDYVYQEIKQEKLTPGETEVITNLRYYIGTDHLTKLVVDIIKAIGKIDVDSFVVEQAPYVAAKIEKKKDLELRKQKRQK